MSIPLPALGINPPQQQPGPMDQYGKMIALKSLLGQQQLQQGQVQLQQQQLKDQQATTKAMLSWDGKDPGELQKSILANGGSSNAALETSKHFLDYRDTASQIALRDAQSGETNLKTLKDKHDQYLGAIEAAKQAPDEKLVPTLTNTINQLISDPTPGQPPADPQAAMFKQQAMKLLQSGAPPDKLRDALTVIENGLKGQQSQINEGEKLATTQKTEQETLKSKAEMKFYQDKGLAPGVSPELQSFAGYMGTPGAKAENYPAYKAAAEAKATQPYKLQEAQAVAATVEPIRQQLLQQYGNQKDARDKIETGVLKPFEQKLTEIEQGKSAVAQAQGGNIAAARATLYKVIGVAQPEGTHRVSPAEVSGFSGMGSLPERVRGSIANALSGDPWTPKMVTDINSFLDAQKQAAHDNLNRGVDNVNKLYGTKVGEGLKADTPAGKGGYWDQFPVHQ
jgi:hypothetical protein